MKLFKEPFFHFVLIGAALFFLYNQANQSKSDPESNQIHISTGRIEQLASLFEKAWLRQPSSAELEGLVQDYILEEIYVRKAKEMGIDTDDAIIRRRLRQKVEFIAEDFSSLQQPTDEELQDYLADNAERFTRNASYSFDQVYINPERHGDDTDSYIHTAFNQLKAGQSVQGDSAMIPSSYKQISTKQLNSQYGSQFSQQLSELATGAWSGPIESGLGQHLVRINEVHPGKVPNWTEIRTELQADWQQSRRDALREELNQRLIEDYQITIEWPDETSSS